MPSSVLDVLVKARALLEKPENWIQSVYAIDKHGRATVPTDPNACTFCLVGAVASAECMSISDTEGKSPAIAALKDTLGYTWPLVRFNDSRSHVEVLAALDRTIATERAKQESAS